MPGARHILTAPPYRTPDQLKMDRIRALVGKSDRKAVLAAAKLKTTTDIVQSLVDRKHGLVTVKDVTALAAVTGTRKLDLLRIIEEAKERFSGAAVDYVNLHKQATETALANGDAKSLDVATRASQWAIERMEHEGKRVVSKEAKTEGNGSTKILIGINLGGKNPTFVETEPVIETGQS